MKTFFKILTVGAAAALLFYRPRRKAGFAKEKNWKKKTNIYEVNIRQYTAEGTFNEFQKHLPRIKHMGVQILWLMPVTPISKKERKGSLGSPYAASDYKSVNPEFGYMHDFKNLVNEAHRQGFKIIIDWVANHTGWDHIWTETNPDFYKKNAENGDFLTASGMADIIELDYTNATMRLAMIDAMEFWIKECKIDGFRCDLAAWVPLDFWKQARAKIDPEKLLFWLGEYDELDNSGYGDVFDASYSWNWMHKTRDFHDQKLLLDDLKALLLQYSELGDHSMRAWFTSNHDENTWNGTEYEKYGPFALPLAVLSVTWNGVPLIYSGQEIPLVSQRLQFFEKDTINWPVECRLHDFYRRLFELKSRNAALHGGCSNALTEFLATSEDQKILAFKRKKANDEVITILNFSREKVDFTLLDFRSAYSYRNIFSDQTVNFGHMPRFTLEMGEYLVYEKLGSQVDQ